MLLSREGLEVVGTVATAAECLRAAQELEPDLILVDVDLGADSGLALAARLVKAGWGVIFMSSHAAEDYAELVAGTGALGFIPKSELCRDAIEATLNRADWGDTQR